MEEMVVKYARLRRGGGRMSGDAGTHAMCEEGKLMARDAPSMCASLGRVESELAAFPGRPQHGTPREGSGLLSMQPVGFTPRCSTEAHLSKEGLTMYRPAKFLTMYRPAKILTMPLAISLYIEQNPSRTLVFYSFCSRKNFL